MLWNHLMWFHSSVTCYVVCNLFADLLRISICGAHDGNHAPRRMPSLTVPLQISAVESWGCRWHQWPDIHNGCGGELNLHRDLTQPPWSGSCLFRGPVPRSVVIQPVSMLMAKDSMTSTLLLTDLDYTWPGRCFLNPGQMPWSEWLCSLLAGFQQ